MEIMTPPQKKQNPQNRKTKTPPTKSPPCNHRIESRNREVLELQPLSRSGLSGHAHNSNSLGTILPRQETLFLPLSYIVAYTTRQHADVFLSWDTDTLGVIKSSSQTGSDCVWLKTRCWGGRDEKIWLEMGACQKLLLESHSCVVFSRPTSELHLILVLKGDSLFPFV